MEYLKLFDTVDDAIGTTQSTPFVGIADGSTIVVYASETEFGDKVKLIRDKERDYFKPYRKTFLKFTAIEDNSTITLDSNKSGSVASFVNTGMTVYYSTDNETYTQWTGQTVTLNSGEHITVYGENPTTWVTNSYYPHFSMTGKISASGNIQSLISADMPDEIPFVYCYIYMFFGCTSLTSAPELPATTLTDRCYQYMFYDCTSLTSAPELPATTLKQYCYGSMFNGCTSLTTAPELPATTLANNCYNYMFKDCTSLTTAPDILPATALTTYCYSSMFGNCTSLTTAPDLPATTLVSNCYTQMFRGCSKLNYIKAMFTTTPSTTYTNSWVSGVASTGTFVKNSAATWTTTGVNGIPTGWTVETATD